MIQHDLFISDGTSCDTEKWRGLRTTSIKSICQRVNCFQILNLDTASGPLPHIDP